MEHGTFLGWIGDDVLHSLYRIADLTVVPSIYEPFGLVALEAMASGCPCIVADTGGLREVVPHEEAGLRFRAHDPEALAEVGDPRPLRRRARPPPGRRSLRAPAPLRLGRRRRADRRGLRRPGRRRARGCRLSPRRAGEAGAGSGSVVSAAGSGSTGSVQRSSCGASRMRITRAGMPATTALAGTSLVTTELVPTIELSPTLTPRRMQAP